MVEPMAVVRAHGSRAARDPERALLEVAFGSDDVAREAWADVAPSLDIDALPFELHGLFPMVASSLRRLGIDAAELPRFDGVRRRLWSLNSLRLRALGDAANILETAGFAPRVTGGMAVLLYCDDLALRPLTDVDVVLEPKIGPRALASLESAGWVARRRRRDGFWMDQEATVIERAGQFLTLRWTRSVSPAADSVGNGPSANGTTVRRSHPPSDVCVDLAAIADVLAFTLVEGRTLPGYFPVRRRADALLLGRLDDPAVDWNAFVERVRRKHAEPEVGAELGELAGLHGAPPPWVPAALRGVGVPLRERLAYGTQRFPSVSASLRRTRQANAAAAVTAVPRELADIWDLPGPASVARAAAGRVAKRLAKKRLAKRPTMRKQRP